MARIRWSAALGTLSADISDSDTTLDSAELVDFPEVTAPDIAALILDPGGLTGAPEVVWITDHAASATTATVLRGQETDRGGAVARAHLTGVVWRNGPTPADFDPPDTSTSGAGDVWTVTTPGQPPAFAPPPSGGPWKEAAPVDASADAGPDVDIDLSGLADDEASVVVLVHPDATAVTLLMPDHERGRVTVSIQGSGGSAYDVFVDDLPEPIGSSIGPVWIGTFARFDIGDGDIWLPVGPTPLVRAEPEVVDLSGDTPGSVTADLSGVTAGAVTIIPPDGGDSTVSVTMPSDLRTELYVMVKSPDGSGVATFDPTGQTTVTDYVFALAVPVTLDPAPDTWYWKWEPLGAAPGGGAVDSVNGQTGTVVLDADDFADGTTNHVFTAADDTKLTGIASGATANQSDATTNAAIALKSPLASPTFTGTPAAPTPTLGDASTKLATTAFVPPARLVVPDSVHTGSATGRGTAVTDAVSISSSVAIPTGAFYASRVDVSGAFTRIVFVVSATSLTGSQAVEVACFASGTDGLPTGTPLWTQSVVVGASTATYDTACSHTLAYGQTIGILNPSTNAGTVTLATWTPVRGYYTGASSSSLNGGIFCTGQGTTMGDVSAYTANSAASATEWNITNLTPRIFAR